MLSSPSFYREHPPNPGRSNSSETKQNFSNTDLTWTLATWLPIQDCFTVLVGKCRKFRRHSCHRTTWHWQSFAPPPQHSPCPPTTPTPTLTHSTEALCILGQFLLPSASIKPWSHLLSQEMVSRSQGWKFNYGSSILSGTFKDAEL